jgi:transposase
MQDGAPGHRAAETIQELHKRDVYPIFWPAFSPDLNPIEMVWNRMKDYIMRKYPDYHSSYDKLRTAVKEAWDVIGADKLQALVREMPARCQAVIEAEERHTKY